MLYSFDELRELPFDPDYSGPAVYFLWRGPKLCYIGQSRNFTSRIEQHEDARDGFTGAKAIPFDSATYLPFPLEDYDRGCLRRVKLETAYIREYGPPFNIRGRA